MLDADFLLMLPLMMMPLIIAMMMPRCRLFSFTLLARYAADALITPRASAAIITRDY